MVDILRQVRWNLSPFIFWHLLTKTDNGLPDGRLTVAVMLLRRGVSSFQQIEALCNHFGRRPITSALHLGGDPVL